MNGARLDQDALNTVTVGHDARQSPYSCKPRICREKRRRLDSNCGGREHRVKGPELRVLLEESKSSPKVSLLYHEQWRQYRRVRIAEAHRVCESAPPGPDVCELLNHLCGRGGSHVAALDGSNELPARFTELVDVTNRVHENSCIDDDHPCRARSSSSSARSSAGLGTFIQGSAGLRHLDVT